MPQAQPTKKYLRVSGVDALWVIVRKSDDCLVPPIDDAPTAFDTGMIAFNEADALLAALEPPQ